MRDRERDTERDTERETFIELSRSRFSVCIYHSEAAHPCAGGMLIFSVSFQFCMMTVSVTMRETQRETRRETHEVT